MALNISLHHACVCVCCNVFMCICITSVYINMDKFNYIMAAAEEAANIE